MGIIREDNLANKCLIATAFGLHYLLNEKTFYPFNLSVKYK